MAFILHIESSGPVCSIALSKDNSLIALEEATEPNAHANRITLLIESVLRKNDISLKALHAVAVSKGPGSYTGLRIGVSTAKGLCYALEKPLIAIDSLQILATGALFSPLASKVDLLCAMTDARRMEVYSCLFNHRLGPYSDIQAEIIDPDSYKELLDKKRVLFFGSGAGKCRELLNHPNAFFDLSIDISARHMVNLAYARFAASRFEDIAYFEPLYLKDFFFKK